VDSQIGIVERDLHLSNVTLDEAFLGLWW